MVGLKSMRKLLPKAQYTNLKNRKSARDSRKKSKLERHALIEQNSHLRKENEKLRRLLSMCKCRTNMTRNSDDSNDACSDAGGAESRNMGDETQVNDFFT